MRTVNIHGSKFSVCDEPSDYWNWIEQGHYRDDFSTLEKFASQQVTCIDAGAWVGAHTLFASRVFKHVYAIEPDPVALEILKRNLEANHLGNVTLFEGALSGHVGEIQIGGTLLGCSCTRTSCEMNAVKVPCTTLREFAKDIPDPLFIKMDVEGEEAKILTDTAFFAERKPDLMLSTHLEWWMETGSDGRPEYEVINKVARLYRRSVHINGADVDLRSNYGDVVFSNA